MMSEENEVIRKAYARIVRQISRLSNNNCEISASIDELDSISMRHTSQMTHDAICKLIEMNKRKRETNIAKISQYRRAAERILSLIDSDNVKIFRVKTA